MSGRRDALGSAKTDKSFQYTADLLAAIFTWGGIGFVIDALTGRSPLFLVIGFMVGNAAGIFLLYLRAQRADARDADRKAAEQKAADQLAAVEPDRDTPETHPRQAGAGQADTRPDEGRDT